MMNLRLALIISLLSVVVNVILGHFSPGVFGIMTTPVIFALITVFISFSKQNINPILSVSLICILLSLHDIGIRLYQGGTHDQAGEAWIQVMFMIGLAQSFIILIVSVLINKKITVLQKVISIIIFPLIMSGYMALFLNFH